VHHPDKPARLRYVRRMPSPTPTAGPDAYASQVATALRAACREQIRHAVRRITVEGPALLARGQDPRVGGWGSDANVLWEIHRRGVFGVRDYAREAGPDQPGAGPRHPDLTRLHHLLYPANIDLAALAILFVLDTGLEPESVRALRIDCLKNPVSGHVEVEYLKRRRHGQEWNRLRVRDGNASTPGGLLRLAIRLTRQARVHLSGHSELWLRCLHTPHSLCVSGIGVQPRSGSAALVKRNGLTDVDDAPLQVNFLRLRKTYKAEFYRATGGQLPLLARGHSSEVAATHYADIPALREIHENAVADGLTEALTEAVGFRVLTISDEQQLTADPDRAPAMIGVAAERVQPLLIGEMDVWLSACRDFTDSPFGSPGQPCPVPFWSCLD
ncbi:hypothetical protein ACFXON_24685, partial [Bacillus subtilis]